MITTCTNIYISEIKEKYQRDRDAKLTDETEIRALIGILFLTGFLGNNRKNSKQAWDNSKGSGVEACYLAMSHHRFLFLMRCLRFDDIRDRQTRKEIDKLAAIRELLNLLFKIYKVIIRQMNTAQ